MNVADLTVDQFQELIRQTVAEVLNPRPTYVKGLDGLCEIFQCSRATAKRIKASGSINKAIRQQGRTFMTNVDQALQLYGSKNSRNQS